MSNKTGVVVGGGLAGLFASLLMAKKFDKVILIERSPKCGGLLRSAIDDHGIH